MPKCVLFLIALGFGVVAGLQYTTAADKKSPPGARGISIVHLKVEAEGAQCLLNLDTDRLDSPVTDIQIRIAQLQWYEQIGFDLICTQKKTSNGPKAFLAGINLKTVECRLPKKSQQKGLMGLSLDDVKNMLKGVKPSSVIPQNAFVFETDAGRLGVLKVTNSDKNGITFQYKLAEDKRERLMLETTERPNFRRPEEPDEKLKTVRRFKAFDQVLQKNGFVVTPEQFPQIFTAYITEIPDRENALPPFITTDSAWETYHVLLEEGVKQLEENQAVRLKTFSRRLLDRATLLAAYGQRDFAKIAEYASIALALQDKKHAARVSKAHKQLLTALKNGTGNVSGPVGFPLSASAFRANSFYTSSPKLANYFSARQWYATVVFPANNKTATSLAVRLAMFIDSDKELRNLWDALSTPYDSLLAKAEDGDVATYASAVRKIVGPKATPAQAIESIGALQKHLQTALPDPQINDQLLDENQHANFATLIKGFRLLPPRRLTSSICFQKTTPPGLSFPSALNFMVACKQMTSPAAVRALQQQAGEKRTREIQQVDPGKLPDSLHGRAMKLIATLQKPPPPQSPKALQTQAWSDKQLWTQLGAWAQQRHTWALHIKISDQPLGGPDPSDAGMVSPYPDFFKSLGVLTQQTAEILADSIQAKPGNVKEIARDMLNHLDALDFYRLLPSGGLTRQQKDRLETAEPMRDRILEFREHCVYELPQLFSGARRPDRGQVIKHIREMARRCLKTGQASKNDLKILNAFARSDIDVINYMGDLADICEQLATIAARQLAGKPLNKKQNRLISNYGPALARLHFYEEFACTLPLDDSPIISPMHVNPAAGRTMYAALGRPHALYVRGNLNGKPRLMLGAVLGYREFTYPTSQPLDDEAWQEMVRSGKSVPQPPTFTKSFMVHPDEDEIVEMLKRGETYSGIDNIPGVKITQAIIAMLPKAGRYDKSSLISRLHARCMERDAPTLLKLMQQYVENPPEKQIRTAKDIITLTANTPCKAIAPELMQMLTDKNDNHANAAAVVLFYQPNLIDASLIAQACDRLSAPRRTLACFLFGHLPKPNQAAVATMLKALQDKNASLRWHGATALGRSGSKEPAVIAALSERINDSNDYVASASLDALTKLGATVDTNTLIDKLKRYCRTPGWTEADKSAKKAIEAPRQGPFCVLAGEPFYIAPYASYLDNVIVTALIQRKCKRAIPVILEIMTGDGFSRDYIVGPEKVGLAAATPRQAAETANGGGL
ncbi:MAG: DUF3160 domain-containing protein, partial [Phycisphaerae bacterium]|nr:DUF3160 domain-containing protein [Phycisphaerae bacterium]